MENMVKLERAYEELSVIAECCTIEVSWGTTIPRGEFRPTGSRLKAARRLKRRGLLKELPNGEFEVPDKVAPLMKAVLQAFQSGGSWV